MSRGPLFPPRRVDLRVFSPTESHALVDDFSVRAARMHARQQPAGVSSVYPVPLRNHPAWSGNNELGREAGFAPDANNRQTIIKLDEWGEPTDWTIALGMSHGPVTGGGFDVTAEISFGVGGTSQLIEVDWVEGMTVVLPLNALTVNAIYNLQDLEAGPSVPSDLLLRATIGRYSAGRRRATRSYGFSGGTAAAILKIPPFASDLLVLPQGTATAAFSPAAPYSS